MLAETYYLGYGTAIIVALVALVVAALPSSFGFGSGDVGEIYELVARVGAAAILVLSLAYLGYLILRRRPATRGELRKKEKG